MSRSGVEVRQDITAGVLRKKARAEKDVLAASRILGIANILDGMDRVSAAKAAGMLAAQLGTPSPRKQVA